MASLRDLVLAEKQLSAFPGWSPEASTGYSFFDAPLEIEGVTVVGLVLHGGCYPSQPECHVSFELRAGRPPSRKKIPLERLDWRSFDGGHTNPLRKGSPASGKRVSPTHLHSFDLNWSEALQRMKEPALRMAQEVDEDLPDFAAVRDYIGRRFCIANIDLVREPDWVHDLFQGGER